MMYFPLVDIILTTFPNNEKRIELLDTTLNSLKQNTKKELYRLTIHCDGYIKSGMNVFGKYYDIIDYIVAGKENDGLSYAYDKSISFVKALNEHRTDEKERTKYLCINQDDTEFADGWLEYLIKLYNFYSKQKINAYNGIAFASGFTASSHPVLSESIFAGRKILFKEWVSEVNMFSERKYFESHLYWKDIDDDTKRKRGKPSMEIVNGKQIRLGSGTNWSALRTRKTSACENNLISIVVPNLVKHIGQDYSSWWEGKQVCDN